MLIFCQTFPSGDDEKYGLKILPQIGPPLILTLILGLTPKSETRLSQPGLFGRPSFQVQFQTADFKEKGVERQEKIY